MKLKKLEIIDGVEKWHCPACGRWCGHILGEVNDRDGELFRVTGTCKKHGDVDLTKQSWSYDDFMTDEEVSKNG